MEENKNELDKIEKDIVDLLISKFESETLSIERASQIAQFVLYNLPDNITKDQIIKIVPSLDDEFIELSTVVSKWIQNFEDEAKLSTAYNAELLIKSGKFIEAHKLMSDYLNKKINLDEKENYGTK